jgi:TolB-like protein/Tfp pilus assembly protein PilF
LGFPVALVFAWRYDITTHGIVRTPPIGVDEHTNVSLRRSDYLILALLLAVVIGAIFPLTMQIGDSWSPQQSEIARTDVQPNFIAVLPFANFTKNDDLEYYGDGMAEEVTNHLSLIDGLSVLTFNISSRYRGPGIDPRDVARELGVRYVVSGSLRRVGDALRISTMLIAAETGIQLWSMAEDTTVLEAYSIQDSITQGVVNAMRAELNQEWGETPSFGRQAPDPEAYDLYLKGRHIWSRRGVEDLRTAVDMLSEVVQVDPNFARGWSALASAYLVWPNYSPEGYQTWHLAQDAAKKALELDTSLAEPRAVLASFELYERDWISANRLYDEALEIEPRNATINYWFSEFLAKTGRYADSAHWLARSRVLDPTYPPAVTDTVFALALYGRIEDAIRVFEYAWDSGVRSPTAVVAGIITGTLAKDYERARALIADAPMPAEHKQIMQAFINVEAGELAAQTLVSQLKNNRTSWPHYVFFVWMATRLGASDLAIEALEQVIDAGGSIETRMVWGPGHHLIEHAEIPRIANTIGLTDYWNTVAESDFCEFDASGMRCMSPQPENAPESVNTLFATFNF